MAGISYYYILPSLSVLYPAYNPAILLSDQTPFDCRANHKAAFEDISPVLLEDHLRKTGSKLAKQVRERGVEEILKESSLILGFSMLPFGNDVI